MQSELCAQHPKGWHNGNPSNKGTRCVGMIVVNNWGVIAMDSLDLGKMIEKGQQELNELIDNSLQ